MGKGSWAKANARDTDGAGLPWGWTPLTVRTLSHALHEARESQESFEPNGVGQPPLRQVHKDQG